MGGVSPAPPTEGPEPAAYGGLCFLAPGPKDITLPSVELEDGRVT